MQRKYSELELVRRSKLKIYKEMNINPYSRDVKHTDTSKSFKNKFTKFSQKELYKKQEKVSIVGRIMTIRGPFIIVKDSNGVFQTYISQKDFPKITKIINILDIGDIVKFEGVVMKTGTNKLTIRASKVVLLSKSLRPLPEKFHGLKNIEERFRRRYLDLIVNDEVKERFWKRTKIISSIRKYFDNLGYMEVDTPILQAILGGATALPFKTHHNAFNMPFYLRIATELPLKKLLVGGIDKVYEIGRLFRNEGVDTTHNPEFTTIEFYESYSNLEIMMQRTEEVFHYIAKVFNISQIQFTGHKIDIIKSFKKLNIVDAINEKTKKDFRTISFDDATIVAKEQGIKIEKYFKLGHIIDKLFEKLIEHMIIEPTFVYGHPIEISPLAAKNLKDPRFTERAELFIAGREYANMFTELNDPIDQLERFESQLIEKELGNEEANEIDMDFVEALEYGMPPAGGCGIGIDRLVMLFTGVESIREVVLFPHLKLKGTKYE